VEERIDVCLCASVCVRLSVCVYVCVCVGGIGGAESSAICVFSIAQPRILFLIPNFVLIQLKINRCWFALG
jgi:hypothetical protein